MREKLCPKTSNFIGFLAFNEMAAVIKNPTVFHFRCKQWRCNITVEGLQFICFLVLILLMRSRYILSGYWNECHFKCARNRFNVTCRHFLSCDRVHDACSFPFCGNHLWWLDASMAFWCEKYKQNYSKESTHSKLSMHLHTNTCTKQFLTRSLWKPHQWIFQQQRVFMPFSLLYALL